MMIIRTRDVLAIAKHLFARWSQFAHGTRHRVNRVAEGGIIARRAGREILLGDRQGRLGIVPDGFRAGEVTFDVRQTVADGRAIYAFGREGRSVVTDEGDEVVQCAA